MTFKIAILAIILFNSTLMDTTGYILYTCTLLYYTMYSCTSKYTVNNNKFIPGYWHYKSTFSITDPKLKCLVVKYNIHLGRFKIIIQDTVIHLIFQYYSN